MRDQRNFVYAMSRANVTYGEFELSTCIFGAVQRRVVLGRLGHFRIGIGQTSKAVKVKPPAMEPGGCKLIAP